MNELRLNCLIECLIEVNPDKVYIYNLFRPLLGDTNLLDVKMSQYVIRINKIDTTGIKVYKNEQGIWHANFNTGIPLLEICDGLIGEPMSTAAAIMYGAGITTAGGVLGGFLGGGDEGGDEWEPKYAQLPDYKESDAARGEWWKRLEGWGNDPNYGAISQDWADIWDRAQKKISQYYWGGVNDPGLAGKVRASAAKRGASQSPALENMLLSMGMQEAGDIKDTAQQQAISQAQFGEQGRTTWLNSLMNLSSQKPAFVTNSGMANGGGLNYGMGNMVADTSAGIGGAFNQYASNKQQNDFLTKLLAGNNTANTNTAINSTLGNAAPYKFGDYLFQ